MMTFSMWVSGSRHEIKFYIGKTYPIMAKTHIEYSLQVKLDRHYGNNHVIQLVENWNRCWQFT